MADEVRLQIADAVARITLSNPAIRNAMTWKMYGELDSACGEIVATGGVRVVVVRGEGRAFAAGTDIAQFTEFATADDGVEYERRIGAILGSLAALPMPTVAVVDGPAVGGGLAIAAMCDLVLATPESFFAVPIARTLGNCLSVSLLSRLYSGFGRPRTLAMLLTASRVAAEEARAAGFVHAVVDRAELDSAVDRLVERIGGSAPLTLAAVKAADRLLARDPVVDSDILRMCYGSRDFREGVKAFVQRRDPRWEGR
ncbi:MAG TPA: enoyl-CoA hydratase [Mycobacteriales bacterium]|nr:enoyl-CoA hydratase [Mycobacteriales bacterium]